MQRSWEEICSHSSAQWKTYANYPSFPSAGGANTPLDNRRRVFRIGIQMNIVNTSEYFPRMCDKNSRCCTHTFYKYVKSGANIKLRRACVYGAPLSRRWRQVQNLWYRSCGANTEVGLGVIPRVACGRQQIDRLSEVGRFLVMTMRQSTSVRSEL